MRAPIVATFSLFAALLAAADETDVPLVEQFRIANMKAELRELATSRKRSSSTTISSSTSRLIRTR